MNYLLQYLQHCTGRNVFAVVFGIFILMALYAPVVGNVYETACRHWSFIIIIFLLELYVCKDGCRAAFEFYTHYNTLALE